MIPYPRSVKRARGHYELTPKSRIRYRSKALAAHAEALALELRTITTVQPKTGGGTPVKGDIVLALDKTLGAEEYQLAAGDTVEVRGRDAAAVARGTATMLQLFGEERRKTRISGVRIHDKPQTGYRGLMIDLARQWHEVATLKRLIVLCRWYRINYLHLHLTDNESFTFPSAAYPQLPTKGRHYARAEIDELTAFARARGVTLLPELDVPGHAWSLNRALESKVGCKPLGKADICPGRESTFTVMETLIGEIAEAFPDSPYIHIGADETQQTAWRDCRYCRKALKRMGYDDPAELYRSFIVRLHGFVRAQGRETIAWEGFRPGGKVQIPHDLILMVFESDYYTADKLLQAGYRVINTSWRPLYVCGWAHNWPARRILRWHKYRWENAFPKSAARGNGIEVAPTPDMLGAQMCTWGQADREELPSLRERLPAMSERLWHSDRRVDFAEFAERLEKTDLRLCKLLHSSVPVARWPGTVTDPE